MCKKEAVIDDYYNTYYLLVYASKTYKSGSCTTKNCVKKIQTETDVRGPISGALMRRIFAKIEQNEKKASKHQPIAESINHSRSLSSVVAIRPPAATTTIIINKRKSLHTTLHNLNYVIPKKLWPGPALTWALARFLLKVIHRQISTWPDLNNLGVATDGVDGWTKDINTRPGEEPSCA